VLGERLEVEVAAGTALAEHGAEAVAGDVAAGMQALAVVVPMAAAAELVTMAAVVAVVAILAMVAVELVDRDLGQVVLGSTVVDVELAEVDRMVAWVEVVVWADTAILSDFD
jgi:hypothetical protein